MRFAAFVSIIVLALQLAAPVAAADRMEEFARTFQALQKQNYAEAFEILTPMAESGDTMAMLNLGVINDGMFGYTPNYAEAMKWLTRAAEAGLADAQVFLGDKYFEGRGVSKDRAQALAWYRRAADGGDANAQVNIGRMYASGAGVTKDDAMAVSYFRKAAEQKHVEAAIWMGSAYETGSGVPRDLIQAYVWTALADHFNKVRDTVEPPRSGIGVILENLRFNMTMEDVAHAEKLAKEWQPGTAK